MMPESLAAWTPLVPAVVAPIQAWLLLGMIWQGLFLVVCLKVGAVQ